MSSESALAELLGRMRLLAVDHDPDGWPAVQMRDITALCDAVVAAYKALDEATTTRLSREDQARFVELILNPPPPNDALKRAFERRKSLFTNP